MRGALYRWMGRLRLTYGGIMECWRAKGYRIDIAFLPAESGVRLASSCCRLMGCAML